MTTLENSYCVPNNEGEWVKLLGYTPVPHLDRCIHSDDFGTLETSESEGMANFSEMTEIPVQHFIDLVEDRICGWRLREVEFRSTNTNDNASNVFFRGMSYMASIHVSYIDGKLHDISIEPCVGEDVASIDELNITTFTDLLTLIKFLTPPTK